MLDRDYIVYHDNHDNKKNVLWEGGCWLMSGQGGVCLPTSSLRGAEPAFRRSVPLEAPVGQKHVYGNTATTGICSTATLCP
jgi:hypothetical protein